LFDATMAAEFLGNRSTRRVFVALNTEVDVDDTT
jgi:hypothetical protein